MLCFVESPVRPGDEFIEFLVVAYFHATDRHRYVQTGGQLIEMFNLDTLPNLVYGELIVKPLQEAGRALGSESANESYSTWFAI